MSENSIEFSLSNSEQRGSWLNSGHRTLDTDSRCQLAEQQQRITQEYRAQVITRVEAERQRQEVVQRDRGVEVEGQR